MAETATAATPFPLSIDGFNRLDSRGKLMLMISTALLAAFLIGGLLWLREPVYAVLFSIQDEKDGGQIVAALQQQNIPYRFSENGHTILVPQAVVHETRLRLAAQGLPKGGLVGFELLENQKLGISQFAEQVNYQRGLEGELARSVQSLSAVKGARVHLAIPKQTAFLRDEQKTSASVLVSLYPGRTLEPIQVAGIVNLVASSVPQLNPVNVVIIDQEGRLISQQKDPLRDASLDPSQLKYVREVEASYVKRIEGILTPLVGANNVKAQVAVDLDFSQTDQVAETYKPNPMPETAIRSQQTSESGGGSPTAIGIPGALSNQPPVPATAPIVQPSVAGAANTGATAASNQSQPYSKNATINYEVDKTIRHTKGVPGTVRRISVAVVVNHKKGAANAKPVALTPIELKQITDLAREAVGINTNRGDTLNVANAPFTEEVSAAIPDTPIWANTALIATLKEVGKYLLFAIGAFWLWSRIVKPMMGRLAETSPETAAMEPVMGANNIPHAAPSYEGKIAAARDMAKQDPKAVAHMIKEWVGGSGHGQ
jgi:flagellar M-ring protein FliF